MNLIIKDSTQMPAHTDVKLIFDGSGRYTKRI